MNVPITLHVLANVCPSPKHMSCTLSDHEILIFRKQQKIVYKQQKYMLRH